MEVTLAAACMQMEHDKAKNLDKFDKFIKEAASKDAEFLAFPEISLQGYFWANENNQEQREYYLRESETVPGPSTELIQKYCRDYNMLIQFGMAEKAGDKMYNTAVLVDPEGVIGIHRKVRCFEPGITCGDHFSVFKTRLGMFSMHICADFSFPESGRTSALQGAEVIVNSTCSPAIGKDPKEDYRMVKYDVCTRAQALFNQVWYILANGWGLSSKQKALGQRGGAIGHSRIISPVGKIVAEVGYEEGLAIANVDIKGGIYQSRSPSYLGGNPLEIPIRYGINYVEKLGTSKT